MSSNLANPIVQMNIVENPASSIVQTTLAKFIDMDNLFSMNNIILLVSLAITLFIVGIKMKIIPSDGALGRILEKIPVVKNFLPAKKQVEFAPAADADDEDSDSDDDDDADDAADE
jgi:uncharacterized membrane protein